MRGMKLLMGGAAALSLAACATNREPVEPMPDGPDVANAELRDANGMGRARASVTEAGDSIRVRIEAVQMAPGAYGAHIHTTGRCDAPGFESAGGHWNPTGRQHGKDNPAGDHKGDLPNLLVGADGRGSFEFTVPGVAVGGEAPRLLDDDGAAVVIHAGPDDYRTDPSGNSGARIACGVLG